MSVFEEIKWLDTWTIIIIENLMRPYVYSSKFSYDFIFLIISFGYVYAKEKTKGENPPYVHDVFRDEKKNIY